MYFEKESVSMITPSGHGGDSFPDLTSQAVHRSAEYHSYDRDPRMNLALRVARYLYKLVPAAETLPGRDGVGEHESAMAAVIYRYGANCLGSERDMMRADIEAMRAGELQKLRRMLVGLLANVDEKIGTSVA